MSLKAGIIGLPNVGKSTVFNALTKGNAQAANYPFTTIEPNIGSVTLPDIRLDELSKISPPKKIVPTSFEFIDIAGLVKGASKGEGLGNQFLSHIREVDAIIHVLRCFKDGNVSHVEGEIDALRDLEIVNTELILADLDTIIKRLPRIEKKAILKVDDEITREFNLLKTIQIALLKGTPIRKLVLNEFERELIKGYGFLTQKPILYVVNISESDLQNSDNQPEIVKIKEHLSKEDKLLCISAQIESELAELEPEDKLMFLEDLQIKTSGVESLIFATYQMLGLKTFFTIEQNINSAWTFKKGMTAPECAGIIHTDFQKGFIRAEVISYEDLIESTSWAKAKEIGKIRIEGKTYQVKDGDIITFRFNV